ncbi:sulfur carrier protein ThiS [Candidatus Palauibacter sp.]|uniref:sulfur carrier protein ThiS n=1 Tax=Candidatus Palauibacter sp. TaxID=3101350 RepID=UPI003B014E08
MDEIRIQVNGRERDVPAGTSVAVLLRDLGLDGRAIVVELNRRIVRPPEIESIRFEAGDRVELVHFVGGG